MTEDVLALVQRWRQGDQSAAFALDRHFKAYLLALVRRNRGAAFRPVIDSQAVVNEAMKSFLSEARKDTNSTPASSQDVQNLLAYMTVCKLRSTIRKFATDKRDVDKQAASDHEAVAYLEDARGIDPLREAEARDFFQKFEDLLRVEEPAAMNILERLLQGNTPLEIAQAMDMPPRTVYWKVQKLREKWDRLAAKETGHDT